MPEGGPAILLVCLEDQRQFECRGDTRVQEDVPRAHRALFAVHVDLDGGAPQAARLTGGGAHHVSAHPGGHLARQQQHLAAEGGRFGLGQTALDASGHFSLQEPLFVRHSAVYVGNCGHVTGGGVRICASVRTRNDVREKSSEPEQKQESDPQY